MLGRPRGRKASASGCTFLLSRMRTRSLRASSSTEPFYQAHHFGLTSDAYIVAPGGIGTALEAMMIWQLLQVRDLNDTPLIFAGPMWKGLGMGECTDVASGVRTG